LRESLSVLVNENDLSFYVGTEEEESLAMRVKTVNLMKKDRRWGVSNIK
jgi:hypothetical protein